MTSSLCDGENPMALLAEKNIFRSTFSFGYHEWSRDEGTENLILLATAEFKPGPRMRSRTRSRFRPLDLSDLLNIKWQIVLGSNYGGRRIKKHNSLLSLEQHCEWNNCTTIYGTIHRWCHTNSDIFDPLYVLCPSVTCCYLHASMIFFIILRQPVTISVTVFSNLTKID